MQNSTKIPKTIHYCWFGGGEKPAIFEKCLASWKKFCPEYEIIEWNESNFAGFEHPYFNAALNNRKYAFASDYARFKVLYEYGGIYLDTDEELLSDLDSFLNYDFFLGFEKYGAVVSPMGGVIGAKPGNEEVLKFLKTYDEIKFEKERGIFDLTPITVRLRNFFEVNYSLPKKANAYELFEFKDNCACFPANYFCEFTGRETVAVHHYAFSWKDEVLREKFCIFKDRVSKEHNFSIYFVPENELPKNKNAAVLFQCKAFGYAIVLVRQPV